MLLLKGIFIIIGFALILLSTTFIMNCIFNGWKYGCGKIRQQIIYSSLVIFGICLIIMAVLFN